MLIIHEQAAAITEELVKAELELIQLEFPEAHGNGLTGWHEGLIRPIEHLENPKFVLQVRNVMDWLLTFGAVPASRQHVNHKHSGYGAKNYVTRWANSVKGEACGHRGDYYVCMMAFIVGARLGGLVHNAEHNPCFNISERIFTTSDKAAQSYGWQSLSRQAIRQGRAIAERIKEAYDCGAKVDVLTLERELPGWGVLSKAARSAAVRHLKQHYALNYVQFEGCPATFQ